jgi:hypothetical protein
MTGPYDDDPTGMFDHLDDAAPPGATGETLAAVSRRGRRIRARRQSAFAVTGAAAVTAAVFAGLGVSHAVNAEHGHDRLLSPAGTATPNPTASGHSGGHRQPGVAVVGPRGAPAPTTVATPPPTPSPASPCDQPNPSASPSPTAGGVILPAPPFVTTASPAPVCASPSPSQSPSPSESPSSSESSTPTPSPTAN